MLHLLKDYGTGETETLCGLQIPSYWTPSTVDYFEWTHYPHQTCPECTKKAEAAKMLAKDDVLKLMNIAYEMGMVMTLKNTSRDPEIQEKLDAHLLKAFEICFDAVERNQAK